MRKGDISLPIENMVDKLTKKDRENAKKQNKSSNNNKHMAHENRLTCIRLRSPCLIQRVTWLLHLRLGKLLHLALKCITFTVE